MTSHHKHTTLVRSLLLLVMLALGSAGRLSPAVAQPRYRQVELGRDKPSWTSRITWWTQLSDWALASPNLGFEFDLKSPERMLGQSISLFVRDGDDSQYRLWRNAYNGADLSTFGLRLDYRWHFTLHRHPERYNGRFFAGPYIAYSNLMDRSNVGLSTGYDFPGLSFGNRHFLEFQLSALAGVCRESPVGEMHLGMTWRNTPIKAKYWQPDLTRYQQNKVENQLARQQIDSLLQQFEVDPLIISVPSRRGDSLLADPVTIDHIRRAFARSFHSPYLLSQNIEELSENTPLPITLPSEYNNVRYRLITKPEDYDAKADESTYVFPFRVRIQGYDAAMQRLLSYNDSLRAAYQRAGRQLPTLYLPPVNRDTMSVSADMSQVQALLSDLWQTDILLDRDITDLYYRQDGEFVHIDACQMNRRGTYAVGLRFHPQIAEAYDSLPTRFNIMPLIANRDQQMFDRFSDVYNSQQFYVEHPWLNGQEQDVTKADVIQALSDAGFRGYTPEQLILPDSIRYGRNLGTTTYGPALQPLQFIFVVEDSVGLRQGTEIFQALTDGVDARKTTWSARYGGNDPHGPIVDGTYDEDGQLVVADRWALRNAVSKYLANINPALQGLHIDETWVEDYQNTGLHNLGQRRPSDPVTEVWTVLRFRYRMLYLDGRPRIATANVAYRIRKPQSEQ